MTIAILIISCLLWVVSVWMLWRRILVAPAASYCALALLSCASKDGVPLLPINGTILMSWLVMTLIVMMIILLQDPALRVQTRGLGYMTVGSISGLAVGLLGYTLVSSVEGLYSIMACATIAGLFLGYLLFTFTPAGKDVAFNTGRFFKYLLAKGFPVAITIIMMGVAAVIAVMQANLLS